MKTHAGRSLIRGAALTVLVVLTTVVLGGCGKAEQYGEKLTVTEVTAVSDILANPASFAGRTVRIEGEISRECPTGCWFDVKDGVATIYVDIAPQGLAIPQHVGSKIVVEGTVSTESGQTEFLGKGVEIH
jgi:hypothetical protein